MSEPEKHKIFLKIIIINQNAFHDFVRLSFFNEQFMIKFVLISLVQI